MSGVNYLTSLFPSLAADPSAVLADPLLVAGCYPSFDYRLTVPDCVPPGQFSRLSSAYRTMASGLLQSVAAGGLRIDHDPVTGANLGLLIEESRTNLFIPSSPLSQLNMGNGAISNTTAVLAPDGTSTAAKFVSSNGQYGYLASPQVAVTANTSYVYSFYARAGEKSQVTALFYPNAWSAGGSNRAATFDLSAGAVIGVYGTNATSDLVASIKPAGNGWYRCICALLPTASATIGPQWVRDQSVGDGTSGMYLWGAQFEAGAFVTSYIPTATAQATRAADSLVVPATPDWFNPVEGTFYFEGMCPPSNAALYELNDGGANPQNRTMLRVDTDGTYRAWMGIGGSTYVGVVIGKATPGERVRAAVSYNAAQLQASVNGSPVVSNPMSGSIATNLNSLRVGGSLYDPTASSPIRRLAYLPRAQSAAVLQRMTA